MSGRRVANQHAKKSSGSNAVGLFAGGKLGLGSIAVKHWHLMSATALQWSLTGVIAAAAIIAVVGAVKRTGDNGVKVGLGIWQLPNVLTMARLGMAVAMMAFISHPAVAFWILAAAVTSDVADGHLARWLGTETSFGAELDHRADFLLTATVVACAATAHWLPTWALVATAAIAAGCWLGSHSSLWERTSFRTAFYLLTSGLYQVYVATLLTAAYGWHDYYVAGLAATSVALAWVYRDRIVVKQVVPGYASYGQ